MKISIDLNAGFCSGVKRTISLAEEELQQSGHLFCLGQVVHNEQEENRLKNLGLEIIDHNDFRKLQNATVLIRAHGEPPETYKIAAHNNIRLIDGTCPIVVKLQQKIRKSFSESENNEGQIVIFGKKNHPEVLGLSGQTDNMAIIVEEENDLAKIDFTQPVSLFAQTTKSKEVFHEISGQIRQSIEKQASFETPEFCSTDSTCRQVTGRDENLRKFAHENDLEKIDFRKPVSLFAQTTKSKEVFHEISGQIRQNMEEQEQSETSEFCSTDSTCRQVTGRDENLRKFAKENDIIIFVAGKKSSNGHYLFEIVKAENNNAFYVDDPENIEESWFKEDQKVGVTGATSTPAWLLEEVASKIEKLFLKS